ncbi:MAG TPA: restriction endonuclease subunit S [Alphaproteobacteria bacterium]|nr:restriction endonuclease subunit S [Alphaproteobacteria bacterium]
MNSALLLENFEALVDGESSIKKLQDIVLQLAIQGKLVTQNPDDASVELLLKNVKAERNNLEKQKKIRKVKLSPINLDDDDLYELPNNWSWVKIGQIGDVFNGNSISKSEKEKRYTGIDDGYNYIATKDVDFSSRTISYENGVKIPFEEEKFKIAHKDAVLICAEGGSAGKKIALTEQDICFGNKLYATESFSGIVPEYLFYVYQSPFFFKQFSNEMTGIIGGISINKFVDLYIPLPPSEEQNRIVEKIKELFDLLKELKHNKDYNDELKTKTVKSSLNSLVKEDNFSGFIHDNFDAFFTDIESISDLRSTILQLAIQGKLTRQDNNDTPVLNTLSEIKLRKEQLIKSGEIKKTKSVENVDGEKINFKTPFTWQLVRLGHISPKITDGEHATPKRTESGNYLLSARNVTNSGILLNSVDYVGDEEFERIRKRCNPDKGDILLSCSGSVGRCCLVDKDNHYVMVRSAALIKVFQDLSANKFLMYAIRSPFVQSQILEKSKSTAQSNLFLGAINSLVIPIPPLEEQIRIVSKVDKLLALCDELEEQILQSQALNGNLMDSIIHHMMNAA